MVLRLKTFLLDYDVLFPTAHEKLLQPFFLLLRQPIKTKKHDFEVNFTKKLVQSTNVQALDAMQEWCHSVSHLFLLIFQYIIKLISFAKLH